jgi:carbonic anhydrase
MMSSVDIPQRWHGTPIEAFIQAQNFGYPLAPQAKPQVLISSCMEFRYALPVPSNYAYVIRTAGGRLIGAELAIAYAISRGVTNLLLIAHNDCGMTKLVEHKAEIIEAFVDQGWSHKQALNYFNSHEAKYAIRNELESLQVEYFRLKKLFKKIHVAPLFLTLSDKRVYLPRWYLELINQKSDEVDGPVLEEDLAALI